MKKTFQFVLILISISSFAQNQNLKIDKGRFYVNEKKSTVKDFVNAMQTNKEAYDLALKAKSGYDAGSVIGFIGGFMIGWPIGTAIGGGDPNWALAGGGAAILVVAIPIMSSATKKMENAVDIYEGNNASAGHLDLKISPSQFGLVYSF